MLDTTERTVRVNIVLHEQTVGELRAQLRTGPERSPESDFADQQLMASWGIGIAALLLATGMAIAMSRVMLNPLLAAKNAIDQVARGNYDVNLVLSRKDELGALMRDVDHLARVLKRAKTTRQKWLADISHELRTPVAAATAELEAIEDGLRTMSSTQLDSFKEEMARLRRLIDDLYELAVSDIGGLKYSWQTVDIAEVVQKALNAVQLTAEQKRLTVTVARIESAEMRGDEQRLHQLLLNLLRNAIAYTDAPGQIRLDGFRTNGIYVLELSDSPPGVSPEQFEQLFEPLHREAQTANRRIEGAGLGLAIARNIVDAHRGTIKAGPSELGGLAITVSFPLEAT